MSQATDLSVLPLPEECRAVLLSGDREHVLGQEVRVDLDWWNQQLGAYGVPGGPLTAGEATPGRATLTREQVLAHRPAAQDGPDEALRLLWHSTAWGAGRYLRQSQRRVRSVADRPERVDVLVEAARLATDSPQAAYAHLRGAVPYLGPAFFTKYLYFAGGGEPGHPCLILDARVATSLHRHGWASLGTGGGWPPWTYGRYCGLLARWAGETSSHRLVHADEIEHWLFASARHQA